MSNLSAEDKDFVMKAAIGGRAEVQMGQTAQQKGPQEDLRMAKDTLKKVK